MASKPNARLFWGRHKFLLRADRRRRQLLGQHFLVSGRVAEDLISSAGPRPDETVLEIGTGTGFLTRRIAPLVSKLISYEVDPLIQISSDAGNILDRKKVELRRADPFAYGSAVPRFDVCISSLPYSRSRDFISWLSLLDFRFRVTSVILQDDFVKKLIAKPGSENYRAVSVISQISFQIELKELVQKDAFEPRPRIVSRIVTFSPKKGFPFFDSGKVQLIHFLFSQRKRLLVPTIRKMFAGHTLPPELASFERKRIKDLEPREFASVLGVSESHIED